MFVLSAAAASKMRSALAAQGGLRMVQHKPDGLWVVTMFQDGPAGTRLPVKPPAAQRALNLPEANMYEGTWLRADLRAQVAHYDLIRRRGYVIRTDDLIGLLPELRRPGRNEYRFVIAHCPEVSDLDPGNPLQEFAGWAFTREEAKPLDLVVEPETYGFSQLVGHWPVELLRGKAVLVVGVGSLGSVVAAALAGYGVGGLHLLDPDRLLWHNVVRHVLGQQHIGRYKTDAMADHLRDRYDGLDVTSHVADVVADADLVRGLLPDMHAVVCAADGIAPRRVVSHLARRAGTDAILTSIMEDGELGEVLRLRRAPDQGCLLCRRAELFEQAKLQPELTQERGYGDGDPHRPMIAVGPDIALVGDLAAKVAVASMLERSGKPDQRLPGEQVALGLRLRGPYTAPDSPYDIARTGDVNWSPATPPRPTCVTCSPP
jgi:hypothetical protein